MPRRGKKKDASHAAVHDVTHSSHSVPVTAHEEMDDEERMDEDGPEASTSSQRPMVPLRTRTTTITPSASSRPRSEARNGRSTSSSTMTGTPRASTSRSAASNAAGPSSRPNSGPRPTGNANQTTPRYSSGSLLTSQTTPSSTASASQNSITSSANTSTASLVSTPTEPNIQSESSQQNVAAPVTRSRSGTITAHRNRNGGSSRGRSNDDMEENDADTERTSGRSGANTEDEDMDAESSNNETEMDNSNARNARSDSDSNEVTADDTNTVIAPRPTSVHRPVAVADPQALSPHAMADSLSLPTGDGGLGMGMGIGMGMGMEVDVLAAVNMVMARDGVAAFEGTQFGGEAANAAAAEAAARAGREGMMEEETPRAVLRNMSERTASRSQNQDLDQVDEEMESGDADQSDPPARRGRSPAGIPVAIQSDRAAVAGNGHVHNNSIASAGSNQRATTFNDAVHWGGEGAPVAITPGPATPAGQMGTTNPIAQAATAANNNQPGAPNATGVPTTATAAAHAAASAAAAAAGRNRFRVVHGDAGPFRQEDVLRALQLLAYLTKYPHVRQEFYKKRYYEPATLSEAMAPQNAERGSTDKSSTGNQRPTLAQVAPVTAALAAGQIPQVVQSQGPQITTLFSLVERFTFRPSMSHLNLHPSMMIPTIPPEIQSWAAVIMRNACRKDDSQGGIRQCANMTCGKWEKTPREFAKCRRCRKAKYCGKECQSKAWSMGHRYWCSAREGGEPGQVPTDNMDHDNEEGNNNNNNNNNAVTISVDPTNMGNNGAPGVGMGIGIAPGGGVGIVPLNNTQGQTMQRGRTAGPATVAAPPGATTTQAPHRAARGPFIVNAGGNAWDPLPPNAPQPGTSTQVSGGGQTSTTTANANAPSTRRRESTPTNSGSTSRLARGFDRLRSLGSSTNAAPNPAGPSGSSSTSNIPTSSTNTIAQQPEASSSRSRPWERFFSRDGATVSASTTMPTGSINEDRRSVDNGSATSSTSNETARVLSGRPSLSTSDGLRAGTNRNPAADDARLYSSLRSRPRENPTLSSFSQETSDIPNPTTSLTPISTSQNELSGLPSIPGAAFSQAATSRLGISTSALNNSGSLFGNGRSSSMVEVPRPGIGARSATGTNMTMLDSNPTDSTWGANSSSDITMD
ncbi:hypothetical protein CPB86DRAFT_797308 [Serendipita vermifera]|nr:hypothetical protein CPB86DRAFT_797308 [Serendipita vermifera]